MCAISGLLQAGGADAAALERLTVRGRDRMTHRGPDAAGYWGDPAAGIGLGHRRLSILDLSPAGSQPMPSACGRHVMVFNGEVYNYLELRKELELAGLAPRWRGHSDTELMLAAVAAWGLDAAVGRFNGMFAFALWDRKCRTLALVRDRAGVKPLYLGRAGNGLVFASELRGVTGHPEFRPDLDREALPSYLAHGYFPAPRSVYRDAMQTGPGTILTIDQTGLGDFDWTGLRGSAWRHRHQAFDLRGAGWRYRTYWTAHQAWLQGQREPFPGTLAEAVEEGDRLVRDSVRMRLVSDVPIGAFLSGGIDSSLVVGAMQAVSPKPARTFTIGFDEPRFDEAPAARETALHLKTDHTEYRTTEADALDVAMRLGELQDEPLADASFIPTYLVSRLTRQAATVALTGDGGDECFGGYWRYWRFPWLRPFRTGLRICARPLARLAEVMDLPPQPRGGPAWYRYRAARLLRLLSLPSFPALYYDATTTLSRLALLRDCPPAPSTFENEDLGEALPGWAEQMMLMDYVNVLPDDLLVKVDRASMAVSLECREPLLDYRLVEFAARLPAAFKVGRAEGKLTLKRILARYLPQHMIDRPKRGFAIPLEGWLRTGLRAWGEDLLAPRRLAEEGLLEAAAIEAAWQEHQAGRADHKGLLWSCLVLLAWMRQHPWR